MNLWNFIRPTRTRLIIFFLLIAYTVIASAILSLHDTASNVGESAFTEADTAITIIAYPAVFLDQPYLYISENVFTGTTSLRQLYTQDGATNLSAIPDAQLDRYLPVQTIWGSIAGLIGEVLVLYLLACLFSLFTRRKH